MADRNASVSPADDMPLISHLIELRDRLIRAVVAVLLMFILLFWWAKDLYHWVTIPLQSVLPPNTSMIATDVTSPFFAPIKLALVASFVLALPYVLWQAWSFIAPALYQHEKRLALPLLLSSVLLFYVGVAFAYFLVFPVMFGFFTQIAPEGVSVMTDIDSYLSFVLSMFLAFGLTFEIPIATVLLVWSGVVELESLKSKRRYMFLGSFIAAAILTPTPDILTQSMLAIPMYLLYEAGVLVASLLLKKSSDNDTADASAESPPKS